MLYQLVRPALFTLSGEQAHDLTLAALRLGPASSIPRGCRTGRCG
mgnify:CR=1 FL=1